MKIKFNTELVLIIFIITITLGEMLYQYKLVGHHPKCIINRDPILCNLESKGNI